METRQKLLGMFKKILQIHNFYNYAGGEDYVLKNEKKLLEQNGIVVKQFTKDNKSLKFDDKLKLIWTTHYSRHSFLEIKSILLRDQPDLVHVHNFFPQITPAVFYACYSLKIPVVKTLHNYRIIHPSATLLNHGKIDLSSFNGSAYHSVFDRVYRNSVLQTAVVAHMIEYHRKKNTWNKYVDKLIALTNFSRNIFIEA